jgi:hypothetical protein
MAVGSSFHIHPALTGFTLLPTSDIDGAARGPIHNAAEWVPRLNPARRGRHPEEGRGHELTAVFEVAMDRIGRAGSGQVQNGGSSSKATSSPSLSAGETTREQMDEAMWQLRRMARGSAGFRR